MVTSESFGKELKRDACHRTTSTQADRGLSRCDINPDPNRSHQPFSHEWSRAVILPL